MLLDRLFNRLIIVLRRFPFALWKVGSLHFYSMVKGELKTTVKPKLSLSVLLKQDVELLTKSSQELEQILKEEENQNPYITHVVKRIPRWFFGEEEGRVKEAVAKDSLFDDISKQISLEFDGIDKEIALEILYRCSSDGFFKDSTQDIAKLYGVSEEYVEDIREFIMMEIEPVGVASRNLEEFIKVQLQEMYPKETKIHEKVLHALKTGNIDGEIKDILSRLRLRPIEGEDLSPVGARIDIILEYDGESWYIFIQEDFIDVEMDEKIQPQDEISKEKFRRAKALKLILEIRRNVLRKIGEAIVRRQEGFLIKNEPLKTLTAKEIAESSGVSMSTVSRVINSRYAKTPAGIYPLKFFFVKESKGGMSKEEVMRAIKEVLQENLTISDSKVAQILKERGIDIARRTVAKYRKLLGLR